MSKLDKLPLTRQGVRNLDSVGRPVRHEQRKPWTCPPHLPADHWEYDEWRLTRMLRCRACRAIIDTADVGW